MRLVFFILLLVNVLVLAYFVMAAQQVRMPAHPPLRPEAIRLAGAPPAAEASPPKAEPACLEWTGLGAADLAKARGELEAMGLADKLVLSGTTDHWVHIPPLKTRAEADKKLAELKNLGIEEAEVVDAAPWRYAISLAAFPNAAEAEFYLQQLRGKGVKSARVVERQRGAGSLTVIQVEQASRRKLEQLAAGFEKTELKPVACRLP